MLERLLLKKLELWLVALGFVAIIVGIVLFGAVVHVATKGSKKFGPLGEAALELAQIPEKAQSVFSVVSEGGNLSALQTEEQRFEGRAGFTFNYAAGTRHDFGYLILSRYDGDIARSVAELVDLDSQKILHRWLPDYADINSQTKLDSKLGLVRAHEMADRARMVHPLVFPDGSLAYKDQSPLIKVDACSRLQWRVERIFHHSTEFSVDGGVWVPSHYEPQTIKGVTDRFKDNSILHVTADGKVDFEVSLPQVLIDNGLGHFIFGHVGYTIDPLHLNDIQEAAFDGPHWKKGDLFLSARNISSIILYRPSTNKVVWHKQWPWVKQHDVDILDDHRIAVFDNHMYKYAGATDVAGNNNVMIYDFATDTVTRPWQEAMAQQDFRTITEGRSEVLNDSEVYIEESNYGRAAVINTAGETTWEYINRGKDGAVYRVNWSRMISRADGDRIMASPKLKNCPESKS